MKFSNFAFSMLILLSVSCRDNSKISELQVKIEALEKTQLDHASLIKKLVSENPSVVKSVLVTKAGTILLYEPFGLNIKLSIKRPKRTPENFMSIPAAYTNKENLIDGFFFHDGQRVSSSLNKSLNGFCIIKNNNLVEINSTYGLDGKTVNRILSSKWTAFQQTLLIQSDEIIECKIFGNTKSLRRGLVQKDGKTLIAMTLEPQTIRQFQESLKEIGVSNAVNLDMGSWSEGWEKDRFGNIKIIGETMINTHRQTNWLIMTTG